MNPATREGRLVQTLQEVAARDIPAGLNLWPGIRAHLRPAPRRTPRPAQSLVWSALATVLLLTVGVAAALTPTLGQLASALLHPPSRYPVLGPASALTQTIGGYTVALEPLYDRDDGQPYANAINISLLATVTDQYGKVLTYDDVWLSDANGGDAPQLTAADGPAFPWLGLGSWLSDRDGGSGAQAVRYKLRLFFDATGLRQVPTDLPMHLSLQLHPHVLPAEAQGPPGSTLPPDPVIGRFTFDFRLPFDPLVRVADVQQTIMSHGLPVTLERVVTTRRNTLAVLRFPSPDGGLITRWMPVADLMTGKRNTTIPLLDLSNPFVHYGGWQRDGSWNALTDSYILDNSGPWTLTVRYLADGVQPTSTNLSGPWVFQFTPPPAVGQTTVAPTPTATPEIPSQTLNGYTVTVYPLSADSHQVVLGYSVSGAAGDDSTICLRDPKLSFKQNVASPGWVAVPCQSLHTSGTDNALVPDVTLTFPTIAPVDGQTRYKMDLSLNVYPAHDGALDATTLATRLVGPFHFEFNVPFDSTGRMISVGRSIDTHGVVITLDRVVITKTDTRLYLSYRAPNGNPLPAQWYPILNLQAGNWSSDREGKDVETDRQQSDPQHLVYTVHTSLADQHGDWTLTIRELQRDNGDQRLIGPWSFYFNVPPIAGTP